MGTIDLSCAEGDWVIGPIVTVLVAFDAVHCRVIIIKDALALYCCFPDWQAYIVIALKIPTPQNEN